jgi:hypothetical protein
LRASRCADARAAASSSLDDAHPLPAPAGRGLQQDWITESLGDFGCFIGVAERRRGARHDGRSRGDRELARGGLAPHRGDRLGRWADEGQAGIAHRAREPLAFGEESITRMDRLGAHALGSLDDTIALEVRFARWRRPEQHGLVRLADVRRARVGLGVHRDGCDAELAAGADHTECDLSAVGDENLVKHGRNPPPSRGRRAR